MIKKEKIKVIILFFLIVVIYVFHYLQFGNYIVDDAGITFGASKTLVEYGRFSIDKYAEIVESYSNPSYMAILAIIYWLGVDLPFGSKILNLIIGLIVLLLVYKINNIYGEQIPSQTIWMNLLSPLFLSLMTGFILWGAVGLENMLYGLASAGLILGALRYEKSKDIVLLTCFSGLVSTTRPEGLIFTLFVYCGIFIKNFMLKKSIKELVISFVLFFIFFCLFISFRYCIFSWILPNTYYAKINPSYIKSFYHGGHYIFNFVKSYLSLHILMVVLLYIQVYFSKRNITRKNVANKAKLIFSILASFDFLILVGYNFYYFFKGDPILLLTTNLDPNQLTIAFHVINSLLVLVFAGLVYLSFGNNLNKFISVSKFTCNYAFNNSVIYFSTLVIFANMIYIFRSGGTWGATRFLTPSLISLSMISTEMFKSNSNLLVNHDFSEINSCSNHNNQRTKQFFKILVLFVLILFPLQMAYNNEYNGLVSFWMIKERHAELGNEVGSYLIANHYAPNPKHISYMVPDLGATSYYAKNYTIIDSAALGNVPIAHNHYEPKFFKHYIFDIKKPELIEIHKDWSQVANYDQFFNNYVLIKGPGIVKFKVSNMPSYYIRKDIFASNNPTSVTNFTNRLQLISFDIGNTVFSRKGEIELNTYWIKNPKVDSHIIDNHTIEVFLLDPSGEHLIDIHKLTGGNYLPSQWTNLTILDKKVIYPENIPDGNYSLVIKIIYPDNEVESNFLENITIDSRNSYVLDEHANKFKIYLGKKDYTAAEKELRIIKGINIPLYNKYYDDYIYNKLDYVETLIANNDLKEADQLLRPITGLQTSDVQLNIKISEAEHKLARLYEIEGAHIEKRDLSLATDYFEYSIWYNPDNSRLREHVVSIYSGTVKLGSS